MSRSLLPAARFAAAHFALLAACLPASSVAAGWEAARFEPPAKTGTATSGEGKMSGEGKQITCATYRDLMVRESDTDTPDLEDATLVPLANGAAPACAAAPGPGARILATVGQRFLGRTGGFLVFEQASTNGTVPFAVLDAGTGRTLIQDTTAEASIVSFPVRLTATAPPTVAADGPVRCVPTP